ncbi:hypothetical protein QUF99_16040 [Bacillus sp. DX4.1]|nr:hypothetical protein [Bacillus sp. DX4.1]MDM5188773.1 hypothetical protein [Bacillus sp. DX4.1]
MLIKLFYGIFLSSFFIILGALIWKKERVTFFAGITEGTVNYPPLKR